MLPHWQILCETFQLRNDDTSVSLSLYHYILFCSYMLFICAELSCGVQLNTLKNVSSFLSPLPFELYPVYLTEAPFSQEGLMTVSIVFLSLMFLLSTSDRSCCTISSRVDVSSRLNPSTVIHLVLFGFLKHSHNIIVLLFFCYLSVIPRLKINPTG